MSISYVNFGDELAFCIEVMILFSCFLNYRKPFTFIKGAFTVLIIAAVGYPFHTLSIAIEIIQLVSILFILFEGKLSKKAAIGILVFLILALIQSLTIVVLSSKFDLNEVMLAGSDIYVYVFTPMQHLLNAIVIVFMKRFLKGSKYQANLFQYLVQMIIPMMSIAAIAYLFTTDIDIATLRILTYIFIIINVAAYLMASLNEKLYHVNTEQVMERKIFEQREVYYKQLDEYQKEMRMIKHDFKNTLLMIIPYIKETAVLNEVNSMLNYTINIEKDIVFCSHKGLNMLLNEKVQLAKYRGIECDFNILVPDQMNIQSQDLGIIVGNLLDNAIEAVAGKDLERYIKLSMIYYNKSLSIVTKNPFTEDVKNLETSKADVKNHGFGTKSIMRIVDKYHGTYEWVGTGNMFCATVFIWDK